jgi:hypothetical protein
MPALAFREDTQLTKLPPVDVTARFWGPRGAGTAAVVSTLPKLMLVPEPELYLDHLQVAPDTRGAVRVALRVGGELRFRAGAGDFALEHDEE